jgi:hypothetical protein
MVVLLAHVVAVAFSCSLMDVSAWIAPSSSTVNTVTGLARGTIHLSSLRSTAESDVMAGVSDFEKWFASVPGAECSPFVSHDNFGNLRGLSYSKNLGKHTKDEDLMKIPESIVLQSDLSQPDWDAQLAEKLWIECGKGSSSSLAGYTSLLTRGWTPDKLPELPPNTAPDALRHWTDEQKNLLINNASGQKLVDLLKQQEELWKEKFSKTKGMTWEQYRWAMEVVNSRAYCGDFGIGASALPPIVTTATPVVAAAAGFVYSVQMNGQNEAVLLGLGLAAAIPAILNLVTQSPPVAVMLPLIDSANHLNEADSCIDYSPLSKSFTLTAGSKCFVDEDGKRQLYVSYGIKKDTELLLNYGFLRGVSSDGDDDTRRKELAEAFLAKQS